MKPDWDKLMEEYKGSKTALVADVDCTTAGKSLCEEHGVRGYPTIKWGDPSALEDYEGGRSLKDFQEFAAANLKPTCSPSNLDLCDDAKKKEIADLQALSDDDLEKKIKEKKWRSQQQKRPSTRASRASRKSTSSSRRTRTRASKPLKHLAWG